MLLLLEVRVNRRAREAVDVKENTVQKKWYEQSEANFTALQSVLQILQDSNVVPTTLPSLVAKEEHHMER